MYGEGQIIEESRIDWIRISTMAIVEFPFKLAQSKLTLEEELIDLDQFTEYQISNIFEWKPQFSRAEERKPGIIIALSFEIDLDQTDIKRIEYTILDLLSDIGGIQSNLIFLFSIMLSIWNHNNFDNHLLINFFKLKSNSASIVENKAYNKTND